VIHTHIGDFGSCRYRPIAVPNITQDLDDRGLIREGPHLLQYIYHEIYRDNGNLKHETKRPGLLRAGWAGLATTDVARSLGGVELPAWVVRMSRRLGSRESGRAGAGGGVAGWVGS